MKCKMNLLLLSEYLDGELGFFRHRMVSRHLRHCDTCRERLGELKAADALLYLGREKPPGTAPLSRPMDGIGEGVLPERLRSQLDLDVPGTAERHRHGWKHPLVVAAVILILVGGGLITFLRPAREAEELLTLGMQNQEISHSLLRKAETVEIQIFRLQMELMEVLEGNRNPALQEKLEKKLTDLSELVVELKTEARLFMESPGVMDGDTVPEGER